MKGKIFSMIFVLVSGLFAGQTALRAEETYVFGCCSCTGL